MLQDMSITVYVRAICRVKRTSLILMEIFLIAEQY